MVVAQAHIFTVEITDVLSVSTLRSGPLIEQGLSDLFGSTDIII